MSVFILKLIWLFGGKRRVRIHLEDKPGVVMPSLEGILIGRKAGHYILLVPKLIHSTDQSIALEGMVEVPAERVVFVQIL